MLHFGDIPAEFSSPEKANIVILPVPYDETSTWVKGADKGPDAIIEASANMELYDTETATEIFRCGIYTSPPVTEKRSPEKMNDAVYSRVKDFLRNDKFIVLLGGEHSVTFGAVKAYKEKYNDLHVLQLDAHADLRPEYMGSKFNHACVMARVKELCPAVQVGIRSMSNEETPALKNSSIFFAEKIRHQPDWIKQVVSCLRGPAYITIDLDVFDPSIMPSTGTPEPGGLGWYDVLDLIKEVNRKTTIVGADVVELCPNKENKAPDFLAAKLIYKLLNYKFLKT